jgi:hypothetical protein
MTVICDKGKTQMENNSGYRPVFHAKCTTQSYIALFASGIRHHDRNSLRTNQRRIADSDEFMICSRLHMDFDSQNRTTC